MKARIRYPKASVYLRMAVLNALGLLLWGIPFPLLAKPAEALAEKESHSSALIKCLADPSDWRGFNLTDMIGWPGYSHKLFFQEWDFKTIHDFGFNFVRLPLDCRVWLVKGREPEVMDEEVLRRIDQAVGWGVKYKIHVALNFHRAPGFCVNKKLPDDGKLWTDPVLQNLFIHYWVELAKRYQKVPSKSLSFNLVNEPYGVPVAHYAALMLRTAKAVWEVSPNRLIICDQLDDWGPDFGKPSDLLASEPRILQSLHNYKPYQLSNYGVTYRDQDWIPFLPRPQWPVPLVANTLLGPYQSKNPKTATAQKPFAGKPVLILNLKEFNGGIFRVRVNIVSAAGASLKIEADNKELGTWELVRLNDPTNLIPIRLHKDYTVPVRAGTRQIAVSAPLGDWCEVSQIGLQPQGKEEFTLPLMFNNKYSTTPPEPVTVDLSNPAEPFRVSRKMDDQWLYDEVYRPWHKALGCRFHVSEFGTYSGVPHEVALAWTEDNLRNFKKMGVGWALWQFRGDWGIVDSHRKDVKYETFEGHQLDREMLNLLQKYNGHFHWPGF